jgi:hypothetical protein
MAVGRSSSIMRSSLRSISSRRRRIRERLSAEVIGPGQERKKAPAIDGQGMLKQSGTKWSVRPCPLYIYIHW